MDSEALWHSGSLLIHPLTPLLPARLYHRLENLRVAGATAKVPGHAVANGSFIRLRILFQKTHCCQDHTGCADAALRATAFNKCPLHVMKLICRQGDSFDRSDRGPGHLQNGDETAVHDLSIDHHGAGATLAFTTAFLCPGQVHLLAQDVEQTLHWEGLNHSGPAIYRTADFYCGCQT